LGQLLSNLKNHNKPLLVFEIKSYYSNINIFVSGLSFDYIYQWLTWHANLQPTNKFKELKNKLRLVKASKNKITSRIII